MKRIHLLMLACAMIFFTACDEDERHVDEPVAEAPAPADSVAAPADTVASPGDTTTQNPPSSPAPPAPLTLYFPSGSGWETTPPDSLLWSDTALADLLSFLGSSNTYGFVILYKGRIVVERYWNGWDADTRYPIASAGKSITSFLIGLAQQEGLLAITDKVSDHLGTGWTSLSAEQEQKITIRHLLSMTSGLDETEDFCTSPECLRYKANAGARWAYHNGPYNLLHKIIEKTSGISMNEYTKTRLADKIGLKNSSWSEYNLELSTRDMARFGWLMANRGAWNGSAIMSDAEYFSAMTTASSAHNKAYGLLWWLNSGDTYRIPGDEEEKQGPLTASAPAEMFAAMGKGDKKIYVIPSRHMVIVRHGDDAGTSTFGPSSFDAELWTTLKILIEAMPQNL